MRKLLVIFLLGFVLTACGSKPPTLDGAINPDKLPVYPGATLDAGQSIGGADMSGDDGAFYAKYWDFKTTDSKEKVVEGKLMTSFTINAEGLVKGAKVEKKGTTLKEPRLHDCVVAVLTAMTFPKPADGKDHPIEYPFNLKAIQ